MSTRTGPVHVATTTRKVGEKVYETHLLRRSYRENGKVKNETVGNISHLPRRLIEVVRRGLRGEHFFSSSELEVVKSLAHGHVALVLGVMARIGLIKALSPRPIWERELVTAMIAGRIIEPDSKLATERWWHDTTLPQECGLAGRKVDDLYRAMDWLADQQGTIEARLAKKYLAGGALVLYDVSSSYLTGTECPLAKLGYSRDHRRDLPQVVYGVVANSEGCPVAVEVFSGETSDTKTLVSQVRKVKERFGVEQMVIVGDRGMIRRARIPELREIGGVDWITALNAGEIRGLVASGNLQLGLFDEKNLMEVTSEEYPGERLVVCRNPFLARERARNRDALLKATEDRLKKIETAVRSGRLCDAGEIGERVGRAWGQQKMRKHFIVDVGPGTFSFRRNEKSIAEESALDGFYVLRTSLPATPDRPAESIVRDYKRLAQVERVFRTLKTTEILVRPVFHRAEKRVRGHIFLCLLAAHVIWHLERLLTPLTFRDPDLVDAHRDDDPVNPEHRTEEGRRKCAERTSEDGHPLHSLRTLLNAMAALRRETLEVRDEPAATWTQTTVPTTWQRRVLDLAGVRV